MLTMPQDEATGADSASGGDGGTVIANKAFLGLLTATQVKLTRLAKKKMHASDENTSEECNDIPSLLRRERTLRRYIFLEHHSAVQRTALKQYARLEAASRRTLIEEEMNDLVLLCVNHAETVSRLLILNAESDDWSSASEDWTGQLAATRRKSQQQQQQQQLSKRTHAADSSAVLSLIEEEHDSRHELEADEDLERVGKAQLRCTEHEGLLTMARRLSAAISTANARAHRPSRDVSSISQGTIDDEGEGIGVHPALMTCCALLEPTAQAIDLEESTCRQRVQGEQIGEMRSLSQALTRDRFELRSFAKAQTVLSKSHPSQSLNVKAAPAHLPPSAGKSNSASVFEQMQLISYLAEDEDRKRVTLEEKCLSQLLLTMHVLERATFSERMVELLDRRASTIDVSKVVQSEVQHREKTQSDEVMSRRSIARLLTQAVFLLRRKPEEHKKGASCHNGAQNVVRDSLTVTGPAASRVLCQTQKAPVETSDELKSSLLMHESESRLQVKTQEASDRTSALLLFAHWSAGQEMREAQEVEREAIVASQLSELCKLLAAGEYHSRNIFEMEWETLHYQLVASSEALCALIARDDATKTSHRDAVAGFFESEVRAANELSDEEFNARRVLQTRVVLQLQEAHKRNVVLVRHERIARDELCSRVNVERMEHADGLAIHTAHCSALSSIERQQRLHSQIADITGQETTRRRSLQRLECDEREQQLAQNATECATNAPMPSVKSPTPEHHPSVAPAAECSGSHASLHSMSTADTMSDGTAERFAQYQCDRADSLVGKAVMSAIAATATTEHCTTGDAALCDTSPAPSQEQLSHIKSIPLDDLAEQHQQQQQLQHVVLSEAEHRYELILSTYLAPLLGIQYAYLVAGEACSRDDMNFNYELQHLQLCIGIEERRERLLRGSQHGIEGTEAIEWALLLQSHATALKQFTECQETVALFYEHEVCYRRLVVSDEQHSYATIQCLWDEESMRRTITLEEAASTVWLTQESVASESTVMHRNRHKLQRQALYDSETKQRDTIAEQQDAVMSRVVECEGATRRIQREIMLDRERESEGRSTIAQECDERWGILLIKEHTERVVAHKAVQVLRQSTKESNARDEHLEQDRIKSIEAERIKAEMAQPVDGRLWPSSRESVAKVPFPPQHSPRRLGSGSSASSAHRRFQASPFSEKTLQCIAEQRRPQTTGERQSQQRSNQLPPIASSSSVPRHENSVRAPGVQPDIHQTDDDTQDDALPDVGDDTWAILDGEGDGRAVIEDEEYFCFFHILLHRSIQVATQTNHSRPGSVSLLSRPLSAQVVVCAEQSKGAPVTSAQLGLSTPSKRVKPPPGASNSATPLKRTPKPPAPSSASSTPRLRPGSSSTTSQSVPGSSAKRLNGTFEYRSHRALNTPPIVFSPLPSLSNVAPSSLQSSAESPTALGRTTVLEHQQLSWRQAKQLQQSLKSLAAEEATHRYEIENYEAMEFVGEIELSFELRGLFKRRIWM